MTDRFVTVGDSLKLPPSVTLHPSQVEGVGPTGADLVGAATPEAARQIIGFDLGDVEVVDATLDLLEGS